ncbi:MAG: PIN domain-containing protein [Kiritimatiellales bacterium]|nr:PIN domain-containing protein [Kiritimatiellales bacterium]
MYLFDTDIIVSLLRYGSESEVFDRISNIPAHEQYLSAISVSELVYGAWRSQRPQHHMNKIRENILTQIQIAPFDTKAAWVAGKLRAALAKNGTPLDFPDLQIAAIALSQKFTLVTGNTRHFVRIPNLKLENWLDENQ